MLCLKELQLRAALFRSVHSYFTRADFLHVDTPVRHPVLIPESNITPISSGKWFLQTSPEICMKRLVATGCEKIYQICPCFRKEERGRRHLEEFTMLEWYRRGGNYLDLMTDCEALICYIAEDLLGFCRQIAEEALVDMEILDNMHYLAVPWQRLTVKNAFINWSPVTLDKALVDDCFDEILVEYIEPESVKLNIENDNSFYYEFYF